MSNDILRQIERDWQLAQKYLISGDNDSSIFSRAVEVVYDDASKKDRALIDARRQVAAEGVVNGMASKIWVVKTQLKYAILTEKSLGRMCWESESQIKRHWKRLVQLVSEVAVRLPKKRRRRQ